MKSVLFIALVLISACSAATDCTVAPSASTQTAWCTDCKNIAWTELICSTCSSLHATADQMACTSIDCKLTPASYTTSWCWACDATKQTGSADGKSCVDIDCATKPTNNYTNDWCNACASPPLKALSDKSACDKNSGSSTTTTTSGALLSFVSVFVILSVL